MKGLNVPQCKLPCTKAPTPALAPSSRPCISPFLRTWDWNPHIPQTRSQVGVHLSLCPFPWGHGFSLASSCFAHCICSSKHAGAPPPSLTPMLSLRSFIVWLQKGPVSPGVKEAPLRTPDSGYWEAPLPRCHHRIKLCLSNILTSFCCGAATKHHTQPLPGVGLGH